MTETEQLGPLLTPSDIAAGIAKDAIIGDVTDRDAITGDVTDRLWRRLVVFYSLSELVIR
jgi:hypothetical protein